MHDKQGRVLANIWFILLAFLIPISVFAQPTYTTDNGTLIRWKKLPVKICVNESIPSKFRNVLTESIKIWNVAFEKPLFTSECVSKTDVKDINRVDDHSVYWVTKGFENFTEKTSLARTVYEFDQKTGEMTDADIMINAQYFDWDTINADLKTVLIHELGHFIGLKHNFISRESVMNYFPYLSGYKFEGFGEFEKNAVNFLYFKKKWNIPFYVKEHFFNNRTKSIQLLKDIKKPSADQYYSLAIQLKSEKKYSQAIEYFKKYLVIKPKDEIAIYQLGDAYWGNDLLKDADVEFTKILKLNPHNYEAAANLGFIYYQNGEIGNAQKYFEIAIMNNPSHYLVCQYLYEITKKVKYLECQKKYSP